MPLRRLPEFWHAVLALGAVALTTWVYARWLRLHNPAVVSTSFLLIVLMTAAWSRLAIAIAASVAAVLAFNFFFLPPLGTFTIADPQNLVALVAFLIVSIIGSNLSAVARARTEDALRRRLELARLFDLSRDVLLTSDDRDAIASVARAMARRFDRTFVALALPTGHEWDVTTAGPEDVPLDRRDLDAALSSARAVLEFDAQSRTYAGHRTLRVEGREIQLVPLRAGTIPIGLLATAGTPVESGTLDALAGIAAIAIERAQLLEDRRTAELTRQSEALKTTLLASIGHDLRTPLTAIRIAATNIGADWASAQERAEQADIVLAETERLSRLFQNILEMARIDAGAVDTARRWTRPSEIVAGAREQVEASLRDHRIVIDLGGDEPVEVDPRLTASALAHLLENAAQYAPGGTVIALTAAVRDAALVIDVRDHGPGIDTADLPHLFDRFYRGRAAVVRASGTGNGLWIARGLLAAQRGSLWADNAADGGARFTLTVPVGPPPAATPAHDIHPTPAAG